MAGERDGGVASGSQADHPARLRWAVNTERWNPEGDHEGAEFTFLLSLLPQHEREDCLRFVHMPDKKRALVSRLLQRAACAKVTSAPHASIEIRRTKGRKPFLHSPLPDPTIAPNFNFNVSHEGEFVVLASEPVCVCGVDVAAPGQALCGDGGQFGGVEGFEGEAVERAAVGHGVFLYRSDGARTGR